VQGRGWVEYNLENTLTNIERCRRRLRSARAPLVWTMLWMFTRLFSLVVGKVDTDVFTAPVVRQASPCWSGVRPKSISNSLPVLIAAMQLSVYNYTVRRGGFGSLCERSVGARAIDAEAQRVGVGSLTAAVSEVAVLRVSHFGNLSRHLRLLPALVPGAVICARVLECARPRHTPCRSPGRRAPHASA
jgi:hypothetical protein